ncbi:MAG TPA: hypothetical protein VFD73_09115, partial [Gemmatimonadales bacterium]|nr:hypothetical protein [Gemmatimonadales bacterium]
ASVTGRPKVLRSRGSIVVDTGLTVSCPIGAHPCTASGQVDAAPPPQPGGARGHLGTVRFTVPGGESKDVKVRLSGRGARMLRDSGTLRVRVSAEIRATGSRPATARQTGLIEAPQPPAFRPGTYTGVTSQGLPIFVTVSRTAVRSAFFRWRGICSDGREHTSAVLLHGRAQVHRGHFSLGGQLDSGGSARVTGQVKNTQASGTLSRTGASRSGARCEVSGITWQARTSAIEVKTSG